MGGGRGRGGARGLGGRGAGLLRRSETESSVPRTGAPLVLEIPEISKPSFTSSAQIISLCYLFILFMYLFLTAKVILFFFFFAQNLRE